MLMRARQSAFTPAKIIFHRGRAFLRPRTRFAPAWLDGMWKRMLAVKLQFES